jgi:hypothetical protein
MAQPLPVVGTTLSNPNKSFSTLTAIAGIVIIVALAKKGKKLIGL